MDSKAFCILLGRRRRSRVNVREGDAGQVDLGISGEPVGRSEELPSLRPL